MRCACRVPRSLLSFVMNNAGGTAVNTGSSRGSSGSSSSETTQEHNIGGSQYVPEEHYSVWSTGGRTRVVVYRFHSLTCLDLTCIEI